MYKTDVETYSPLWSSSQSSARQSTSQIFMVCWWDVRGETPLQRSGSLVTSSEGKRVRLQLPSSDLQLHPAHTLRGKGKITEELHCFLSLLTHQEWKLMLRRPLLEDLCGT